jgi:aspartyl-tRNA(Asn)/glutamyl-tRNA(Gln) amidotransferase subunit C
MSETISQDLFAHLVDLAALELTPEEADYLRQQLNNQLKSIDELAAIPLGKDIPITSHGVPYTSETSSTPRADIWRPYPNSQDILAQAPETDEGYIIVPDIPHTSLE